MTLPPVAFVGLGAIGAPMAAHLAEGGRLTVWNRTRAVAERFAARHQATVAATPRDAAAAGELVLTCLPTSREVEAVLDGPDGLLAGFRRGALLIDCTSGDPASSRRIAARLAERGVGFVDAPLVPPLTGASTKPTPRSARRAAMRRELAGSPEVQSIRSAPPRKPARRPSEPSSTASTSREVGRQVSTISAAAAASRGVAATRAPWRAANRSATAVVRFHTVSPPSAAR